MSDEDLLANLRMLPEELQKEALHYISYLLTKPEYAMHKVNRKSIMGKYANDIIIHDDFDAPLEEFND
jgi:hypothetical protein